MSKLKLSVSWSDCLTQEQADGLQADYPEWYADFGRGLVLLEDMSSKDLKSVMFAYPELFEE